MFGYNYNFTVNPEKNVINLKPTAGTYAKAFGPSIVIAVGYGLFALFLSRQEKNVINLTVETHQDPED